MRNLSLAIKIGLVGVLITSTRFYFVHSEQENDQIEVNHGEVVLNEPTAIKMFNSIERFSAEYEVPLRYALGIAFIETRYQGPFHWGYNPEQKSSGGALGPMQIMPSTANLIWGEKIPHSRLISDIDFNIETSMKLLRKLYNKYGDWKIVFGCYNTGTPCVNEYANRVYNFNP